MRFSTPRTGEQESDGIENVVKIYRCSTVVKGGRRFSFSALVACGDGKGSVGIGYGKARDVPSAVEKAMKEARAHQVKVPVVNGTIPHEIVGRFGAVRVILSPAGPGTGITAGGAVRAVVEAAGIGNILTKCHRTMNLKNVVKATMDGLLRLRTPEQVEKLRGVKLT